MRKFSPLFVSYFYPPVGGAGLPGAQRTVKFLRYLQNADPIYVLTLKPEFYPDNLTLNFQIPLPVSNEIILREEARDRFIQAMQIRSRLSTLFAKETPKSRADEQVVLADTTIGHTKQSSFIQKIKDFIYHFYYFPDQIAAPWLRPAVRAGLKLVSQKKIDIIFATGMPWTALLVAYMLHKKTGIPFIADFRDPWLGNPFLKSKGILLDWRERRCEGKIVSNAALITANTKQLQEEFIARYPTISEDKIICLPNGFDSNDFVNISTDKKEKNKKLVLAHAGFLYGKRDPAPLFEALELLCAKTPYLSTLIEFSQYGGISLDYNLEKRYSNLFQKGIVKILGQIPYKECLSKLLEADILVIIQPGTKTQIPSKLYDYLCINRPIITITPQDGALGTVIQENGFGDSFEPEEIEALAGKLLELCQKKQLHDLCLTPNYRGKEQYDIRFITKILEDRILQVLKSTKK